MMFLVSFQKSRLGSIFWWYHAQLLQLGWVEHILLDQDLFKWSQE